MAATTKRSSAKCTPPLLRNCTGALCPRKKTRSGKIFGVISAALRTVSCPAGEGLAVLASSECRKRRLKSSRDRKTKHLVKRSMETPFRMRESYNISFRSEEHTSELQSHSDLV